jgi:gliding motility-associated-like protein
MFFKFKLLLLLVLVSSLSYSQCSNSSGAPIVFETFGAGASTIGPPLPAGFTNMQYIKDACPLDGQYSIVNYTSSCFANVWHTVTDHTGDKNGYFMLINASVEPSDFFVQTVNGLCAGTTYEFSAYILNMINARGLIEPNITFTVEHTNGTILATYNSGDVPVTSPAKWARFGFYFKTPENVSSVVIRMHNNAKGGPGNDLALDDISFRPAGPPITISINGTSKDTITTLCNNNISIGSSIGSCFVKNAYQWQESTDGNTWTDLPEGKDEVFSPYIVKPGTSFYRLSVAENGNIENPYCRSLSNVISITYIKPLLASVNAQICEGSVYKLPWGKIVSTAGIYADTLRNKQGCDSSITIVNLAVKTKARSNINAAVCEGQSYSGYSKSGTYVDTLVAANGCDSIRTLHLVIKTKTYSTLSANIHQGSSYFGYTKSGTYTDILVNSAGCDSIRTINLLVKPNTYSTFDVSICPGDNYMGYIQSGAHVDTLLTGDGDYIIRTINLTVNDKPAPNIHSNSKVCIGDTVLLNPGTFAHYLWQDGSTAPTYTVTKAGTYWVQVTNENGCEASDTVTIKESYCNLLKIPNAFTPNNDGINDTWDIDALQYYPNCKVSIYSRWGQLVYNSVGYPKPWDGLLNGKKLGVGAYYYVIDLKNNQKSLSGYVTIIR